MTRSAEATCSECKRGPSGIAGHDALFSQTMSAEEMHFRCKSCQQAWARKQRAADSYSWVPICKVAGSDVPGRPGTTPP
jgi:Zn finger protein HypA/HybF involved in hydrogenase expression